MSALRLDDLNYAVVGSPHYPKSSLVRAFVRALPPGARVISNSADDVGLAVLTEAKAKGLASTNVAAELRHSSSRDIDMIVLADVVVAFWDGECARTGATVDRTMSAGKRLWIANGEGKWTFHD